MSRRTRIGFFAVATVLTVASAGVAIAQTQWFTGCNVYVGMSEPELHLLCESQSTWGEGFVTNHADGTSTISAYYTQRIAGSQCPAGFTHGCSIRAHSVGNTASDTVSDFVPDSARETRDLNYTIHGALLNCGCFVSGQ
jgi:hypothetical protein